MASARLASVVALLVVALLAVAGCGAPIQILAPDGLDLASWERTAVPDSATVHTFTSAPSGVWGVDYGSGLVLTRRGDGSGWTVAADLAPEYLERIQFVDAETGFVCGDYGFVYRTDDGGATWTEISPAIAGRITEPYRDDEPQDQSPDGWFVAYYDLHFESATSGYVWGFQYNPARGFRETRETLLYTTRDGGASWQRRAEAEIEPARRSFFDRAPQRQTTLAGTYFLDAKTRWRYEHVDRQPAIARSTDGGATWSSTLLPETPHGRWIHRSIVFADRQNGLAFGGSLAETDPRAVVFRTWDGGATWTLQDVDWPHVHHARWIDGRIYVSTKESGFYVSPELAR